MAYVSVGNISVGDNRPAYIVERDRKEAEAAQRREASRQSGEELRKIATAFWTEAYARVAAEEARQRKAAAAREAEAKKEAAVQEAKKPATYRGLDELLALVNENKEAEAKKEAEVAVCDAPTHCLLPTSFGGAKKEAGVTRLLHAAKALKKAPVQNAAQIKNIENQLNIGLNSQNGRSRLHQWGDRVPWIYDPKNRESTDKLLPGFRETQGYFVNQVKSLRPDSLPTKLDYDQVRRYIQQLTSQHALDHGKHLNPNIHRSGYPKVNGPLWHGDTVTESGLPATVRIYPNPSKVFNEWQPATPPPRKNTAVVWHEAVGHGLDPVLNRMKDVSGMQQNILRDIGVGPSSYGRDWHYDLVNRLARESAETRADAVAVNAAANPANVLSLLKRPFGKPGTVTPGTLEHQHLSAMYNGYGGLLTGTRVPENYVLNATGNPQRDAATLLKEVGVNHSFNLSDYFRDNRELLQAMLKRLRERREQRILAAQAAAQSAAQPSAPPLLQGLARFFGFAR